MKTVVSSSQVAHLWAHKTQSEARTATRNFYFRDETIYSYGGHFPIARHTENSKGEKAILFTTRDYSNTTSKHKLEVRRAIPKSARVFFITHPDKTPSVFDVKEKEANAAALLDKASRARSNKSFYLSQANAQIEQARELVEFFGLNYTVSTPEQLKDAAAAIALAREEENKRERERQERAKKDAVDKIAAFKAGLNVIVPSIISVAYGRLSTDGKMIVTSKGANVPIQHVAKAAPMVKTLIENGRTYKRNGHTIHLGHYVIDEIKPDGTLVAGCHVFEKAEVLRVCDLVEKL